EAFLREAETKAETYLCETAEPPFQRESLEMLRKNAPYFDIFVIVTEQERYANRPQATAEKPSEYHENVDTLQKLEDLIKIMEAEVKAQFTTPGSEERFEAAQQEFRKIQDETGIIVARLHYELGDEVPADQQIQEVHEKTYLTLPAALWNRYEVALTAKDNLNRFKRSRKSILSLKNFDRDDAQLREGLAAFFADYFEVKEARGVEVNKLSKVMSLDHPITAIRFNAADKKPFDSRRGFYDFH